MLLICNIYYLESIAIYKLKKNKKTREKEKTTKTPEITSNRRADHARIIIICRQSFAPTDIETVVIVGSLRISGVYGQFIGIVAADWTFCLQGAGGLDVLSPGPGDLDAAGGIFFLKVNLITASDFSTGIQ